MKVLAIETATAVCATALVDSGKVVVERSIVAPHIHSEKLIMLVDEALARAKQDLSTLDGIAVSIGSGSFTGLRIGLSVAKGLAYATDMPLVAVPTLEALAWNVVRYHYAQQYDYIIPMIDARRHDVYCAIYRFRNNTFEEVLTSHLTLLNQLHEFIPERGRIVIVGDGVVKLMQYIQKAQPPFASRIAILPEHVHRCSASSVGLLGEQQLLCGKIPDLTSLEPLYVKDFYTLLKTQHPQVNL
ncbi:MAG: tRNA (adenosine(37)-N6)-threonylcarbamoyltransferase complex dimerization subunit type 1 TsaB [Ignavibacteriae bacterium]|nr:tRNA (adenosine(37)-N6)-threonylcarbamoyltransferase complex dimerization subunit type 1 TsaB [Ignavibacteriota bacterium]